MQHNISREDICHPCNISTTTTTIATTELCHPCNISTTTTTTTTTTELYHPCNISDSIHPQIWLHRKNLQPRVQGDFWPDFEVLEHFWNVEQLDRNGYQSALLIQWSSQTGPWNRPENDHGQHSHEPVKNLALHVKVLLDQPCKVLHTVGSVQKASCGAFLQT